jgi:hypothetical protein
VGRANPGLNQQSTQKNLAEKTSSAYNQVSHQEPPTPKTLQNKQKSVFLAETPLSY